MSTDLSLIVIAHHETAVCGPTMRSADRAVEAARDRGYVVQTIIGLDAATEATTAYFHQARFDHWERRTLHESDPGEVHDGLLTRAEGRYIAVLDAGDLISENWLAEGVAALGAAAARGERAVAHPELNVIFDGDNAVHLGIEPESALFSPQHLYFRPYWGSRCLAPRDAHMGITRRSRHLSEGMPDHDLDLELTIRSLAAGWRHLVVRDTIIFNRRRELAVAESRRDRAMVRALPWMAIDRVLDLCPDGRHSATRGGRG